MTDSLLDFEKPVNRNGLTEEVRQKMVELVYDGKPSDARELYETHLNDIGMAGLHIGKANDNTYGVTSQFLGNIGSRYITTDWETKEFAQISSDLHDLTTAKVPLQHRRAALTAVQKEIDAVSAALTLSISVTSGKTINEPEAAKLGAYTGWASSGFVAAELKHIMAGHDDSHRKFLSQDGSVRFGVHDVDGRAITTQTELQAFIAGNKPVFVYEYPAENPLTATQAEIDKKVEFLKLFVHRKPSNYPAALSGQALINTLAGGMSVLLTDKQTLDPAGILVESAQRGFRRYYTSVREELGLTDLEVDLLSGQIQLANNRGWEKLADQFSAVAGVAVGQELERSRMASDLPDHKKPNQAAELAGINALYVHSDMEGQIDKLATSLATRIMSGNGRVCVKPAVVLVDRPAYQAFKAKMAQCFLDRHENADSQIGLPIDSAFSQGAIYNQAEYDAHLEYFEQLREADLELVGFDGTTHGRPYPGIYASPFVAFAETPETQDFVFEILRQDKEVFSANTIVMPVDSVEEAVVIMNISSLGLGDGFLTNDPQVASYIYRNLNAGGSIHWNDFSKFISDGAPAQQHAHSSANPPKGINNTGVTGSLDSLRQLFDGARDFAITSIRVPAEHALGFLAAHKFVLPEPCQN